MFIARRPSKSLVNVRLLRVFSSFPNFINLGIDAASAKPESIRTTNVGRGPGRRKNVADQGSISQTSAAEDSLQQPLSDCLAFGMFLRVPFEGPNASDPLSVNLPGKVLETSFAALKENHICSEPAMKLLESMLRSPLLCKKIVQLVCPHPGGEIALNTAVDTACDRLNYKVLRLNLHQLFQIVSKLMPSKRSESLKAVRDGPSWENVFVPYNSWIKTAPEGDGSSEKGSASDMAAIEEEDEDYFLEDEDALFEDEEDFDASASRSRQFPADVWRFLSNSKAVFDSSKVDDSKRTPFLIKFSNFKDSHTDSGSAFKQPAYLAKSLYSVPLPASLGAFVNSFERFLEQESASSYQKIIVHISDATDFACSSARNASLLLELVSRAQKCSVPVVLNCFPSVINSHNLQVPTSWWDKFFTSKKTVSSFAKGDSADGSMLLTSVFDNWAAFEKLSFIKVPFVPPAFVFDVYSKNKIQKWTRYMNELQQLAVFRLNMASVSLFSQQALPPASFVPALLTQLRGAKAQLPLIESWKRSVWQFKEVEQLLTAAAGMRAGPEFGLAQLEQAHDLFASFFPPSTPASVSDSAPSKTKKTASEAIAEAPSVVEKENSGHVSSIDKKKLNNYERKALSCVVDTSRIDFSFSDLIVPPSTVHTLQSLVTLPLLQPEMFTGILRKHSISGVLLFGPPGTGKSALAKAVAKSCGANFMNISLSDVFEKYVGEGEKNVKAIFSVARRLSPTVLFLDEVDALFAKREGFRESRRDILNEFMSEWDGVLSSAANDGSAVPRILVMAATNRPFDLDDAILRRLPRRILVGLPDEDARREIIKVHLRDETLSLDMDSEISRIASRTKNWSGSDLKNLCVSAAMWSVKEHVWKSLYPSTRTKDWQNFEAWGRAFDDLKVSEELKSAEPRVLEPFHFQLAFKEIGPSLHEDMVSMSELLKWDKMFGSGANLGQKRNSFGFHIKSKESSTEIAMKDETQSKSTGSSS